MYEVWFVVSYLHLISAAVLLGGAILLSWDHSQASWSQSRVQLAAAYEQVFWMVAALLTVTGVSNLGLKGAGLLGVDTRWGRVLLFKLAVVLLFLAGSFVRTTFVSQCAVLGVTALRRNRRMIAMLYAVTALTMCGMLWLGLGLAHGRY